MGKQFSLTLSVCYSAFVSQREANGLFNTIEDSGVNTKFVNAVYDALLNTVRPHLQTCLQTLRNEEKIL